MTKINWRPYQIACKNAIKENYDQGVTEQLIVQATGCHIAGTKILMYDGSFKNVEDIRIDNLLMGDDSTPRRVYSLAKGKEEMFKIIPIKGEPFIVNRSHILSLKKTTTPGKYPGMKEIVNISVNDYLKQNNHFKHLYKLYRTGVNFQKNWDGIDPYIIGLWLGDGSSTRPLIVSADKEIDEYLLGTGYVTSKYHKGNGLFAYYLGVNNDKFETNPLWVYFSKFLNSKKEKYVQQKQIAVNYNSRIELLAGLIDSDGSISCNGYDFINKNESIANAVVFLARSVGLAAYISKSVKTCSNTGKSGFYYRVSISGETSIIPCKVLRKKAKVRKQKKDVLVTGFSLKSVGVDNYYGFQLDGNHLYCLSDFTVTHNTGKRLQAVDLSKHFKRTLFIAHREELIQQAQDEIEMLHPFETGIVKGKRFEIHKRIVIASVQTLYNRLDKINPDSFDYVVVDEAHHYVSPTFLATVRHFTPRLRTVWTATPKRLDGLSLSNIAQKIVFEYRIQDGIKEGFLAPIEAYQIKTNTDISKVKKVAGDFNMGELSVAIDTPERNERIVEKYIEYAHGMQGIAFTVDIDHAHNLMQKFIEKGITCAAVSSDEVRCPNRAELIQKFKDKEIQVLTNVNILCLDMQTEVLTNRGWLNHDQMKASDLVANYTLDGHVFFKEPEEIVKRNLYDFEKMVIVKSKQSDIRVTSTHRMIYKTGTNRAWHKSPADNLVGKKWAYPSCGKAEPFRFEIEQPYNLTESKKKRMITATAYNLKKKNGYTNHEARIEAQKRCERKLSLRYKNPDDLTLDECRLIGFWLGDGSVNNLKKKGVEYTLSQSKVYPNIVRYIDRILNATNIDNIKRDKGTHYVWSIPRGTGSGPQEKNGIFHLELYLNKKGTDLFWGLDKSQIESLTEGLWYADGLHGKAEFIPETKVIGSTFYELLSLLQAVLVCRGFKANINKTKQSQKSEKYSELYILTIEKRLVQSVMSEKDEYRMNYDPNHVPNEEVWCVKTESKNIITRRNGRVCIMGNTEGFDYPDVGIVMMGRPTQSEVLYTQCIGRGTRLKTNSFRERFETDACIVLDFVDNTGKHSLVNAYELEKDKPIEERMFISFADKEKLLEKREKRQRKMVETYGRDSKIDLLRLPEVKAWNSEKMLEPATEKQIKWLQDIGLWQEDAEYTKAQASELISNQRAQGWQVIFLAKNGYDVSAGATVGQFQKVKWMIDQRDKFKVKN